MVIRDPLPAKDTELPERADKPTEEALRQTAEAALRDSERRYRELATLAPIGIFETDPRGTCTFVNDRWCELTGLSFEQARRAGWIESLHPGDRARVAAEWRRATLERREFSMEFRCLRPDGRVLWLSSNARAVRAESGELESYLGTVSDVTARHEAEAALRETTALWRGILDGANHSIIATDSEGIIQEFNRAAERMLGYTVEEVVGKATPVIIHDRGEMVRRAEELTRELGTLVVPGFDSFAAKARTGLVDENEWTYVRKDGSRFPVLLAATALRDPAGRITGYLGVASDITLQKRSQEDLIKAKEAAESAARAKSEFLARMSHEIRTPMNSVIGMTSLALETPLTPEQRDYLEMASGAAKSLLHLINDILDFSRIEAGRLVLEQIPFGLRDCVSKALRGLAHRAHEKGLEFVLSLPDSVPDRLIGDPHRLQQVLVNLVSNAIRFTERGEVVVSVAAEAVLPGEATLRFSVSDTGLGIPPEHQARIFDAFSQADESITRRFGGTGLGLAVCSQLVEMMGGRIWVESVPWSGSRFHFTTVVGRATKGSVPRLPAVQGPLDVLVVEDNETSRSVLTELVSGWRMRPVATADRAGALAAVRAMRKSGGAFRVVLLDATLPGTDSASLAAELLSENGQALCVFLSSGAKSEVPDSVAGAHVVRIAKPVVPSNLLEVIQEGLGYRPQTLPVTPPREERKHVPLRILVAEDNTMNQRVAQAMLTRMGHTVVVADDGRVALERLAAERFDVVLMDVQMPGLSGIAAVENLREREGAVGIHTPVIALTAQVMKGDRERCLAAGMDHYLAKPIDATELSTALADLARTSVPPPKPRDSGVVGKPLSLFDRSAILRQLGNDARLFREITDLFRHDARRLMNDLSSFIERREPKLAAASAHQLKGMLLNLAARGPATIAKDVEEMSAAGVWEMASRKSQELRDALAELDQALSDEQSA